MNREKVFAYARDDAVADKLRAKIMSFPDPLIEELKTEHGGTKFEFFATMLDGIELMRLGASAFGRC